MFNDVSNAEPAMPSVQELQERIEALTKSIEQKNEYLTSAYNKEQASRQALQDFKERVKTVLVEALDDYDEETIRHIASNLDIELTITKQIEVNVTFTIDIEHEIGEEPDPEWDFDFSVSHSNIVDYSSDVVYHRDA